MSKPLIVHLLSALAEGGTDILGKRSLVIMNRTTTNKPPQMVRV